MPTNHSFLQAIVAICRAHSWNWKLWACAHSWKQYLNFRSTSASSRTLTLKVAAGQIKILIDYQPHPHGFRYSKTAYAYVGLALYS